MEDLMKNLEMLMNTDEDTTEYLCNEDNVEKISQHLKDRVMTSNLKGATHLESVQSYVLSLFLENEVRLMLYDNGKTTPELEEHIYNKAIELLLDDAGILFGRTKNLNMTILHLIMFSHRESVHEIEHPDLKLDCGAALIKTLLENGVDINARTGDGSTPLHLAASNHCDTAMKMLLDTGDIDVNCSDTDGYTVLSSLTNEIYSPKDKSEHTEIATSQWLVNRMENCLKLFISSSFDMNYSDTTFGNSSFHLMLQNFYITLPLVQKYYELCHPDLTAKNYFGLTPLHLCAKSAEDFTGDRGDILKFICTKQPSVIDETDINGKSALIYSITESNLDFCKVLLEAGAVVNSVDKNGCTPLHYAAMSNSSQLVTILITDYNAAINAPDHNGDTPIVYAAAANNVEVFKVLFHHQIPDENIIKRLLSVTEFNGSQQCCALINAFMKNDGWKEIDGECLSTRRIEIDPYQVDAFLDDIDSQAANQPKNDDDSLLLQQFYTLQKIQNEENEQICMEVKELFKRASVMVENENNSLAFTPILQGSNSEGTKIGVVDELDYVCNLHLLANKSQLEIEEIDQQPGLVHLKSSASDHPTTLIDQSMLTKYKDKTFLSSSKVSHQFLKAICKAFAHQSIWEGLHLAWDYETIEGYISTFKLLWTGINIKGREISVDVVPALKLESEKSMLNESHLKFFESINLNESFRELTVVAKLVRSENATRPDLLWRISYSAIESKIFQNVPQVIRDAYKLIKLTRDKRICPYIRYPRFPLISQEPTAYISSYMLKTSVFHEILHTLLNASETLNSYNAKTWASKFLHRLEESMRSSDNFPTFFDVQINLKIKDFEQCIIAYCKIGIKWLELQWEDIYDGKTVMDDGALPSYLSIGNEVVRQSINESLCR